MQLNDAIPGYWGGCCLEKLDKETFGTMVSKYFSHSPLGEMNNGEQKKESSENLDKIIAAVKESGLLMSKSGR